MKVIVGQEYEDKATPVFSDSMEFVVFRPVLERHRRHRRRRRSCRRSQSDPGISRANNMEYTTTAASTRIRQRPGPKNALGFVKFLFPNDFNIYLHDTPNHELFKKDVRAFSHGCIRVEKPAELAQWVLGWDRRSRVQAMMNGQGQPAREAAEEDSGVHRLRHGVRARRRSSTSGTTSTTATTSW